MLQRAGGTKRVFLAHLTILFSLIMMFFWGALYSTGQEVVVVRCEQIEVSGNFYRNKRLSLAFDFNNSHLILPSDFNYSPPLVLLFTHILCVNVRVFCYVMLISSLTECAVAANH